MNLKLKEAHEGNGNNYLTLQKGSQVRLGDRSSSEGNWPNWIYCYTPSGGEGWAPVQIIQIDGEYGFVLEDYTAKELEAHTGEVFSILRELNGWYWCRRLSNEEEGWLPTENFASLGQ